jgi:hypothetical protein
MAKLSSYTTLECGKQWELYACATGYGADELGLMPETSTASLFQGQQRREREIERERACQVRWLRER